MSQRLKEIHDKIKTEKSKRKGLKEIVKNTFASSVAYRDAVEAVSQAKEKLKRVKAAINADLQSELKGIDLATNEIKASQELLSDVAITELMQGQTVEIDDPDQSNILNPVFKVSFKPTGKLKR